MMNRFLRPLFYFSAAIGVIAFLASFILPDRYITPSLPFLILLFTAVTILSFYYLQRATDQKFIRFVNTFLLTILLKLFFFMAVMVSYALIYRTDAIPFLLTFFILYLLYTVFESVSIIRFSHKPGSKG